MLIASHDVTRPVSWQKLLEAAGDLDIAGRMAFERVVARELDEAMQARPDLDPAHGDRLSAVLVELDRAFAWSSDMRHLVRILGEPSGAHPLVFAVERFGVRAPRLAWTDAGFPIIPPADLGAWFAAPDHPAIKAYQTARQRGGFGLSWSWFAFLSPPAWAVMDGRPLLGVAMMGAALTATLTLFDPVVDVGTANAYVSFMVAVVMSRIALAIAARPLGIARLVGVVARVDARAPASSAERRKLIAAGRTGSRFGAILAAFLFLVSDGYALELAIRSLFLAPELVAAVVGPADRKDPSVTFAERLVVESYLETSADLVEAIDKLVRDSSGSDAGGARHMAKLLALQQEVHRAVDRLPIGDYPRDFADLRRRGRMPHHDRYPYSPITARPRYDWPDGKRLAFYIGLNLEWFDFGDGLGAELAPGGPHPDVLNYAWRDYGNRVGVFRLLQLFDDLRLPVSLLINSRMLVEAPAAVEPFIRRGDEIVGHGRSNSERQGILDEAAERALIEHARDALAAATGVSPAGWLGPWISQSRLTPDLLHEAGFTYCLDWCHDDQPTWMKTRGGRILAVPYPQELNDIPQIVGRKREGSDFGDMIVDAFDVMIAEAADRPLVMGVALHPYLVGHPHRFRHLARALRHVATSGADLLWCTTSGAIARHAMSLPEGIVPA
eukprot:gene24877-32409_t